MDQFEIAKRIQKARKNAGFTQNYVAKSLGLTYQAISNYERGINRIEVSTLSSLCDLYKVPMSSILQDDADIPCSSGLLHSYKPTHRIPILGRVPAGSPLYADENIEGYTYTELNSGGEYFALRIKGDSMNAARIFDNDIVIVRRQDIVENGQIAIVMVDDQDATIKRFSRHGDIVTLMPQSTNPIHMPLVYDLKETPVKVLGLVVECKFTLK